MLAALTEFPYAGSRAFLKPSAEPCRIIRHNPSQLTVLVMLTQSRDASATRTVPFSDLAETETEARPQIKPARAKRQRKRRAR